MYGDICKHWAAKIIALPLLSIVTYKGKGVELDLTVPEPTRLQRMFSKAEEKRHAV